MTHLAPYAHRPIPSPGRKPVSHNNGDGTSEITGTVLRVCMTLNALDKSQGDYS